LVYFIFILRSSLYDIDFYRFAIRLVSSLVTPCTVVTFSTFYGLIFSVLLIHLLRLPQTSFPCNVPLNIYTRAGYQFVQFVAMRHYRRIAFSGQNYNQRHWT